MARAILILSNMAEKAKAVRWIAKAPLGTRVEFRASKRTLPQNDLMWSLLTEVAQQKSHGGRKYTPDQWKAIFMNAIGREAEFVPTLNGSGFFPLGQRSSELTVEEMSELIEFIKAWGAQNGVSFASDREAA